MIFQWLFFSVLLIAANGDWNSDPHDYWHKMHTQSPMDIMTDVINELGLLVLQHFEHHGNVAFSPTGAGFVLLALYEGSAGKGKHQIGHTLNLPQNDQITRIGMRDIHRRLRSYLNSDGFLGGLTLNKNDINLRQSYQEVLNFYGFNFFDNSSTTTTQNGNTGSTGTTGTTPISTSDASTTPLNDAVTIQTTQTTQTTQAGNLMGMIVDTSLNTIDSSPNTMQTSNGLVTTTPISPTMMSAGTTVANRTTNSSIGTQPLETSASSQSMTTVLLNQSMNISGANQGTDANGTQPVETTTMGPDIGSYETGSMEMITPSTFMTTRMPTMMSVSDMMSTMDRQKRSANEFFNRPYDDGFWMRDSNNDYQYPPANVNSKDEIPFVFNKHEVSTVPAATYSTILPYAYFPFLKAAALEFPLDDPRYNILIFLPTDKSDTHQLIKHLSKKSLRLLRKHLQSTWVKVKIPSFSLEGFVTLTPYLQKLGIKDVFEPRVSDLSQMTSDLGVYARDVQQKIAVNITNNKQMTDFSFTQYPILMTDNNSTRRDAYRYLYSDALVNKGRPAHFFVEQPFLYFIIDTYTSVTLIAGRLDDPLNSRIL